MNAVQIASQFYDARDVLRRLLGSKFDSTNEPYRLELQKRMAHLKIPVMKAALVILQDIRVAVPDIQDQEVAQLQTMAAAVELIEGGKTQKIVEALTKAPNTQSMKKGACGCGGTKYGPDHLPQDHAGWQPR